MLYYVNISIFIMYDYNYNLIMTEIINNGFDGEMFILFTKVTDNNNHTRVQIQISIY